MNPIQTLDYFLSYTVFDSNRTFLGKEQHYEWVMSMLIENTDSLIVTIYEMMDESSAEAAEHLEQMIPELELLIARLPGDAAAYGVANGNTVPNEIKYVMEELLGFMRDREKENLEG